LLVLLLLLWLLLQQPLLGGFLLIQFKLCIVLRVLYLLPVFN
jgi:hypothetical protein